MKVTILGCGPSAGVPQIGATYDDGFLADPRNHRLRSSICVEHDGTAILVDTSPDLRQQLLNGGITRLDAVLFTHAHADHCHGIDDLRRICRLMKGAIPAYGNKATMTELDERFGYVFAPMKPGLGWYKPHLPAQVVADEPFEIGPIRVTPFAQDHIVMETLGFRFDAGGKSLAYSIDLKNLGDAGFAVVAGVDLWIVDCLNLTENPIHSDLKRSLAWIERAKPKRALLSHMADDIAYEAVDGATPDHVAPAYDGLEVVL
jgi:phosphoribosyl 1,2-cyclic phosphate phosphodiesterase